ncbi:MAG TPA: protein kinase [Bryobacteraceae bacterium]|jgi:serine/threonine protein kinase/tetratricopeptide (TPR) repeat protein|nr:protein kinase [Bryobacteraceae bacterium]
MDDGQRDGIDASSDPTKSISGVQAESSDRHQLTAGNRLAGRFVIIQFLARGGMGEVYEAADEYLQGKHCALKTLRPEIAADPAIRQRFEREVLLSRAVSHANVCPTYDLFREDSPSGPLLFLTMKLLRGESLSARLSRVALLTPETALPIIRQMAAALDAAHKAGVIHRDFKPGNVMLETAGSEVHVSITDFGLSRLYESDTSLTQTGQMWGTPGYIAPELFEGQIASPASDVYAFGVVLYEMLTGRRPANRSGNSGIVRPSRLVAGLPRVWDRVILGCLANEPGQRFQSAGEAVESMGAGPLSRSTKVRTRLSRRRLMEVALGSVVVGSSVLWMGWPTFDALLHPLPHRRFVAMMQWPPGGNPQDRPLLRGVLDAVGANLARSETTVKDLLVISSDDVAGLAPVKSPSDAVSALGANLVLAASLHSSGSSSALSLEVMNAATGSVLRHKEIRVAAASLASLPGEASTAAASLLDLPEPRRLNDRDELAHVLPDGYRFYLAAEDWMSQPNDAGVDSAIETYQKALDADPRFALGYARLAMAYIRKYIKSRDVAALSLADKNADLAARYNPDSAKAVLSRGLVELYSGNTERALDAFDRALRLNPGDPQILLHKAVAFGDLGRLAEEEQGYREIVKERPNFWPAYNELGTILSRGGDYRKAAEAYAEGANVAPRVALPLANLGSMYLNLSRNKDAEEAFRRSLERAPNEQAYFGLGDIEFEVANYRGALEFYGKARDLRPTDHTAWRDMGDCYAMLSDSARVQESYARAAQLLSDSLRTNPRRSRAWMTLGFYEAKLGRRAEAEADIKNAESRGATDAKSQLEKAEALALLGRKDEAVSLVLDCMKKGISKVEVEYALDLKDVRADPRYRNYVAHRGSQ